MSYFWIFLGGGTGALLRFAMAGAIQTRVGPDFPWGTMTVNVAGCFAIGLLATLFEQRELLPPEIRVGILVGVLGGFTTFSTFGLETFRLMEGAEYARAVAYVVGSCVLGLVAVIGGVRIARWLA